MNKKVNNIHDNEFESAVKQAMHKVGREKDANSIDEMSQMDEADFRRMLGQATAKPETRFILLRPVYRRVAAACVVLALIIGGINFIKIGSTDQVAGYASLFNAYYNSYNDPSSNYKSADWKAFDAGDSTVNAAGRPNTAALLQRYSRLLQEKSKRKVRAGIRGLETLTKMNYKPELLPEIYWYLSLGYLKDSRIDDAIFALEEVTADSTAPHAKKAVELRQRLKAKRYPSIGR